ncbi:ARM repeat-containing protein [Mytilinidion resinicola]|uniref:Pumilio homology domain family member 3 n=1 Tax=Mytilinidion resinicola TaxID=574789 RepID=A0A6A6YSI9_9PEZI|nr:ARM repeat-containing protein [Mytilinidion resinicola]KAF2811916.1 ARM repeat-containing protein [Mytilinidion resinicola]
MESFQNRSRIPELGVPIDGDSERPAHKLGWGGSIWNSNSNFPAAREKDSVEGKIGQLVASSESDAWNIHRSPWDTSSHSRSGVSPARQRVAQQPQPTQAYTEATMPSSYFTLAQGVPSKPLLDPSIGNFSASRPVESIANGFGAFGRLGEADALASRPAEANSSWDNNSLHSPTDDRRSIAASSTTQSRSGSLPPSRHGDLQFPQNADAYSRLSQPVSRHNPSFSSQTNGRAYQERSGSIQSDSLSMFGRLSISNEVDQGMAVHKPSMSVNGLPPYFSPTSQDPGFMRDITDMSQVLVRPEETQPNGIGSFTPDGYANGHLGDHTAQLRQYQFDSRSAPNGTGVRQSPYYSQTHTPPVYDHLYPSRADQVPRVVSNGNLAIVERKLRGYQQLQQVQQEQQNFINAHQFQQQHYQQMIPHNQFRAPYYSYGIPNSLPVNGIHPGMALQTLPGMMPVEPPKAPREHEPSEGYRSLLMQEFKQNNKTSKRYELKDIYDHIVEFSGDQHGSRFIQQKLETANSDEKERVFKELQSESLQLMQDVFGNYVIQKFFEHGDQNQKRIIASRMKGHVVTLSVQMYACRVVQKALEHILTDQQAELVRELEKDVIRCVKDQNGNHVIQKVIERVPPEYLGNTIAAFKGQVGFLAAHTYGCRVIQRLLEHCDDPARASILQELHLEGAKLIPDQYGNYVTQHIIEHGRPEDRVKITALVKNELAFLSKHKFASNVVEKCLTFGTNEQRREIMLKTLENDERGERVLAVLLKDAYGNYVVQKLLDTLSLKDFFEFVEHLQPEMVNNRRLIPGKQAVAIEKKMHRFDQSNVSPRMDQRNSVGSVAVSTDISAAPSPPPLVNDAQSPQSCSLPSTHSSTVGPDELVHASASKGFNAPHAVSIANAL